MDVTSEMASGISKRERKLSEKIPTEIPNEFVEEQTKRIPNLFFMGLAGASIAASAYLTFSTKKKDFGNFIGLWVPTILLLGLYNKVVKVEDELLEVVRH